MDHNVCIAVPEKCLTYESVQIDNERPLQAFEDEYSAGSKKPLKVTCQCASFMVGRLDF